jgi:methionyl-tRNA formyltransferase
MEDLTAVGAELAVVVAFGRIIPAPLLDQLPMVNLHFSLLPRWRGAAPVERALLAGDPETGVCLMKIDEGLDTGPVYARLVVPIGDDDDLITLRDHLVDAGCTLLVAGLADGVSGLPVPEPQSGVPTIAAKLTPADLELHWDQGATQLDRVVRLGRAWTTFRGKRLGILKAMPVAGADDGVGGAVGGDPPGTLTGTVVHTGDGGLRLDVVQPESRSPMAAEDWVRGARVSVGERFGTE